jgi:hypothetical protein
MLGVAEVGCSVNLTVHYINYMLIVSYKKKVIRFLQYFNFVYFYIGMGDP